MAREKEKLRSDLEKAEKLKSLMASEVDDHHAAIERRNEYNLRYGSPLPSSSTSLLQCCRDSVVEVVALCQLPTTTKLHSRGICHLLLFSRALLTADAFVGSWTRSTRNELQL